MHAFDGATYATVEALDPIRVNPIDHISILGMVHGFHVVKVRPESSPVGCFIGSDLRSLVDVCQNGRDGLALVVEHERERPPALPAFAYGHDVLPLRVRTTPVDAVLNEICFLDVTASPEAVDLHHPGE